ncbi:MAG TPA: mannose-1-phosphate guanyltransferase, partial [Thermoleophilia bacterium]|nr:mannose-1-phosphate guanyltransferase [Thermoleophilia bacterium]
VAAIPDSALVHRTVACPSTIRGTVMRAATERLQREMLNDGGQLSLVDGIRVSRDNSWTHLLPDAREPVFHVYAEGADRAASQLLADTLAESVRVVVREHGR